MNKLFLLFFIFLAFLSSAQELKISGTIKDSQNRSISSASVSVIDESGDNLGYNFSDGEGHFSVTFKKPDIEMITVEISCLGYEKKTVSFSAKENLSEDFILEEKSVAIQEVVIEAGKKIRIDQDTTTIKVASFGNKTEQTIEDILKKLPGIEVTKEGMIKAHGKPIDKLLIEGEDMFDKNYKLLSKNLDAKVLDAVQIIDAFEDNPILKKLNNSDKVAINLKLKKNMTNVWFGNISLGSGIISENRWKESMNIGLLKKKIKLFYLSDYNNLGEKATDLISENVLENSAFGEDRFEYKAKSLFNISSNEIGFFNKTQSVFNTAFLNSLSFTTKINQRLSLRGVFYVADDKQNLNSFSRTDYNIDNTPISFTENSAYKNHKTLASAELELKYHADEKNYITNLFIFKDNPNKSNGDLFFNSDYIGQLSRTKNFTFYDHFNHTYQVAEHKVLNNYIYFGNDNINEKSKISSPYLNVFFNANRDEAVYQIADNDLFYIGAKSKLISKFGKIDITNGIQLEVNHEEFKNVFLVGNSNNADYENNTKLNQLKLSFENTLKYNFSKKFDFTANLNFINTSFETETKNNIFIVNPSISFNIKKTSFGNFILSYSENSTLPAINQLTYNFQLTDYRSFARGTIYEKPLKNKTASLSYYFFNDEKRFSVSTNLFYIKSHTILNTESIISNEFNFSSYRLTPGGESYNLNLSFVNYIRKLKIASKIETIQMWNSTPLKVNSNSFSNAKNYSNTIKYSATTYFKLPVNLDGGFTYNYRQSEFNTFKNKNTTKEAFANFNYAITETLLAEFNNSFYFIQSQTYSFNNIILNYAPAESKFSYRMIFNNINNEDNFTTISLDNYTSYKSETKLVPRYLLLSVKYRF